jgi:hypothetical protein
MSIDQNLSYLTPIGWLFLAIMVALAIILPKRYLLIPVILTTCYMTFGQVIYFSGFHFSILRIIIAVSWVSLYFKGKLHIQKFSLIDKIFIAWVITNVLTHTILVGTSQAFVNRMGFAYNAFGLYGLFRLTINTHEDIKQILFIIAAIIFPLAISMLAEMTTQRNIFSVLGGVPETTWIREGRTRCQGPFLHPILAGTFGATLIPLFVGLMYAYPGRRKLAQVGLLSSLVITVAAGSSGPVMSLLFGVMAIMMWPFRDWMRDIRWGLLIAGITLHIIMKAPVWYVISHIGNVLGGTGWHRAFLIDQAIAHFGEWWLFGSTYTAHWMPYALPNNPGMADITNQYLNEGINGGMITMLLFIAVIVFCFKILGVAQQEEVDHPMGKRFVIWCVGSALFSHIVTFMSVSYFDQIIVMWFLLISIIVTIGNLQCKEQVAVDSENPFIYSQDFIK